MEVQLTKEEALRERILQAAQQLFQHYGLRKVTMDDIARAAGRGKSSLYYYYKSKDEIFDVVLDREISGIMGRVCQAISQLPTASAQLEAFAPTKVQLLREKTALYSLLYQEIYHHYSLDFANSMRLRYQATEITIIEGIIAKGIEQQEFRKLSADEITQTASAITTSLFGFDQDIHGDEVAITVGRLQLLMRLLIQGLRP